MSKTVRQHRSGTGYVCTADVPNGGGSPLFHMCGKTAKHDPVDGKPTRCGIHSDEARARRSAKTEARYVAQRDAWAARQTAHEKAANKRDAAYEALRLIAEGHNDPRALAVYWVVTHDKPGAT